MSAEHVLDGPAQAYSHGARLPDLPEELLQHVLKQLVPTVRLPSDPSRRAAYFEDGRAKVDILFTCIRSSKLLYRLTHPLLYHTLDTRVHRHRATWRFTLLLVKKPQLASLVREIHVDMTGDYTNGPAYFTAPDAVGVDSPLHTLTHTAENLPGLSKPLRQKLSHAIRGSYIVAERALLWALCPKVRILSCTLPGRRGGPIGCNLNEYNRIPFELITETEQLALGGKSDEGSHASMLSNVSEICVESPPGPEDGYSLRPCDSAALLALPSLRSYHGWFPNSAIAGLSLRDSASSLVTLRIDTWELHADSIAAILRYCPQLKVLDIRWFNYLCLSEEDDSSSNPLQFGGLAASFVESAKQLHTLRLNTSDFIEKHRLRTQRLSSLAELDRLRYLEAPIETLLPNSVDEAESDSDEEPMLSDGGDDEDTPADIVSLAEMLPSSLRTLKIMDDWGEEDDAERLDEQLRFIMTDERFAELRSIRVRRTIRFDDELVPEGWDLGGNRYWVVLKRK